MKIAGISKIERESMEKNTISFDLNVAHLSVMNHLKDCLSNDCMKTIEKCFKIHEK